MPRLQLSESLLGLNQENEAGDQEELLGRELGQWCGFPGSAHRAPSEYRSFSL